MDATTAASVTVDNIQLLNQDCSGVSIVATMTLTAEGKAFCFNGIIPATPWNWIDPLSAAPGDPTYQFRRINLIGDAPGFGPLDGVWTKIGISVVSATPNPGGTGYALNDTLTLTTGTSIVPATLNVDSVSVTTVSAVSVVNPGSYSVLPDTLLSPSTVEPAGGNGCLLDLILDSHFAWGYIIGGLSGSWDVQIRKGSGPVLRTARWSMSTS